ncbi:L-serine ammonia-lyase [Rhodopirellula sp. MGV]|uniref:L-serine ammonia-lyase n=1 Tax=Rhodopirellula sp. MGV TaxID=2023130 RepID=UPI000B9646D1|nr:L-serine ammonia-lyase [Rhodopirellula sp. MGV]OYP38248.1 L-serine ammonia-lyase [Rhodopirellula sp. MGV]PNY38585.1 L-serine ammonia-lyase [Rhodopirellula baltica]
MSIDSQSPEVTTEQDTYVGVFDLFKIGIGPSSSHSVGPMRAAEMFLQELVQRGEFESTQRVRVELFGSLALTGLGHATDTAVLMGLRGEKPDLIEPESVNGKLDFIRNENRIELGGTKTIPFIEEQDLIFNRRVTLDAHPNAMTIQAFHNRDDETPFHESTYFSIGGGFVVREGADTQSAASLQEPVRVPYPFSSGRELLELTDQHQCSLSDLARANERMFRSDEEISSGLQKIWQTMQDCVKRGCETDGILPGGLNIRRRAPGLYRSLRNRTEESDRDPMGILDWVDLYAIAVNEENAAGGRVVTAPTNGAAGIVPAVLLYLDRFGRNVNKETIERFLLTAAVIGSLYKRNASISGAEVGCQGEVGVACSMAAGALAEALGGSPRQVEEAAEIGMEHNLGLTCDPIKGLVQVPCIERNAMGAVKAINASRLALRSDGKHFVSLDRVIRVMKRTGADMSSRYKETSGGGLAVNISEC